MQRQNESKSLENSHRNYVLASASNQTGTERDANRGDPGPSTIDNNQDFPNRNLANNSLPVSVYGFNNPPTMQKAKHQSTNSSIPVAA